MSTHVLEHPNDWDAQRARLSALLDDQLSATDAAALRAHVAGCVACAGELEALRRVVAALGALPQPVAPRSFALPDDASGPRSIAAARAERARWAAITQWAGAAAACVGFFILFGTFALGSGFGQPTAATFGAEQRAPSTAHYANPTTIPPSAAATSSPVQNMDASTPRSVSGAMPSAATPSATATPSRPMVEPTEAPDPRAVARTTGVSLLLGGLVALLLGWGVRRRGAPR